ncbi:beta-propeller fold lactonase family protein [bacterium]|nr:beta-propeller fold lactonase family protein [Balneola sp.]MBR9916342.1 beta-propeller fold lactonase family protein [bacterium]
MRRFLGSCLALIFLLSTSYVKGQIANPQYIYTCNQGSASISVIDNNTHEIATVVDLQELGFSANAKPHHVIAEADGSYWYVTLIGENRVLKFNRDNKLVAETEIEVPGLMTMDPDSDILYVGRSMSAVNPPQSFGVINRSDMSLESEKDLFFTRPHAITTLPGSNRIFVGSLSSNQFLSVSSKEVDSELTNLEGMNHMLVNFAISPDKKTMVGTGQMTGKLLIFDITNPVSPALEEAIAVNAAPWHPVFSPDGRYVYFANKGTNTVTVIDMKKRAIDAVIEGEGLSQPHGAALSADGKFLYVSNNNRNGGYLPEGMTAEDAPGTVVVIDTQSKEIIKVIEVGKNATGIGTNVQ